MLVLLEEMVEVMPVQKEVSMQVVHLEVLMPVQP